MNGILRKRAFRAALFVLLLAVAGLTKAHAQAQGGINGVFSVSENTQVVFSQGNLQYQASTDTWRFAEHQWDYVGQDNANISSTYDGWIDLFGWGTSGWDNGNTYYHPWDSDNSDGTLYGPPGKHDLTGDYANADWGIYNAISNGGNQTGQWRTLTSTEWNYVFNTRSTTSGIRYAKACVNNVNGVILLPDDWNPNVYGLNNTNSSGVGYSSNVITALQWTCLQSLGAVFLPASGRRSGTSFNYNAVYGESSLGVYWSSSCDDGDDAWCVFFEGSDLGFLWNYFYRCGGRSVRLARPAENYSSIIHAFPYPAGGGAVSGSGAYPEGTACTLTATPAAGFTFVNWTENGEVVSTNAQYSFTAAGHRTLHANFTKPGNIIFADANVKALCVANWDTNNDGELSYDEAASVTDLGTVFRNNTNITSFAELQYFIGLSNIRVNAFNSCSNLTTIALPSSLQAVGTGAFQYCNALTSVYYTGDIAQWCGIQFGNNLSNPLWKASLFYVNNVLTRNVVIPNTVTSIGDYAFYNYRSLLSLTLPSNLTSIGDHAFYYCDGLTGNLTLPNTLTSIGANAFAYCNGLTGNLTLPNTLTSIGECAFYYCSGFNGSITLPNTLTSIGNYAFYYCSGLTGGLTLPNTLTSIGNYAFYYCSGLTGSLTLPNTLTSIGTYAFYNCSGFMGDLALPNSLTSVGERAFYNCDGFTNAIIPNSVTSIGQYAFYDCDGLTSVTIGTGVSQIGGSAFYSCNDLEEVNFNATGCSSGYLFQYCSKLHTLSLGENVLTLGNNAFTYCTNLQTIRSAATTPPVITSSVFPSGISNVALYVPCEAKTAYQADPIWGNFTNYQDSEYQLTVASEDVTQGTVSIEQYGTCEDPTCIVKANPSLHYGFVGWLKDGQVVSTDRQYSFELTENTYLTARFESTEVLTHYWIPIEGTQYNMVVNGIIIIDGVEQESTTLEVGAFCGNECRASGVADYFPPTQQYVAVLTIVSNVASGETITFKLYDHEAHQERTDLHCANTVTFENLATIGNPLGWYEFEFNSEVSVTATVNPVEAGTVTGAGMYLPGATATMVATANTGFAFKNWTEGGTVVSTASTYEFTVTGETQLVANFDYVQTQSFVNGWNWWSSWIELPAADGLTMLENSLGSSGVMVLSQNANVQNYYPTTGYDYWFGSLSGIDLEKGYKISTSEAVEVSVIGPKANPANHPITMKPNWNWIGYPVANAQSIATALGSYVPSANDVIVGQSSSTTYYEGYGWFPANFTMTPGKSYIYKSTASSNKTLVFAEGRGGDAEIAKDERDHHWTPIEGNLYNMTLNGVILIDGVEQQSTTLEVGAFCGDECRASEYASYFPPTNQYVVTLTILSNVASGETITFKLYDPAQDVELDGTSTVPFVNLDQVGTMGNWFPLEFISPAPTGFHFTTAGNWSVASNWQGGALPGANDVVFIDANCTLDQDATVADLTVSNGFALTLQSGKKLTVTGTLTNAAETGLVINVGAQLINASANVAATMVKRIEAYTSDADGWYTIASPMDKMIIAGSDFLTPTYDLYRLNEANTNNDEWENYKASHPDFTIFESGRGYLYANSNTFSPAFTGTLNNAAVKYDMSYTVRPDELSGFNLIGNPFPHVIYKGAGGAIDDANLASGFYTLTNEGAWHVHTFEDAIQPGQGILVKTTTATELSIVKSTASATSETVGAKSSVGRLNVRVTGDQTDSQVFAYFCQGVGLDKMDNLSEHAPSLWIRDNGNDYAIAHIDNDYESLDVYFGNNQSGDFTMVVSAKDTNFSYLRLIDNIAGEVVDLLEQPSYTFHATGDEFDARFRLVFKTTIGVEEMGEDAPFAFISDGQIILTGMDDKAMVQIIDALERIIVSRDGTTVSTAGMTPGVYVLRLIDGNDVRTQKIVIK